MGQLVSWGSDSSYQISDTPTTGGFIAIAAGGYSSLAQRADGSWQGWGHRGALVSTAKDLRLYSGSFSHYSAIIASSNAVIDIRVDTDADGIPDSIDFDDDNDGVEDELDAFPLDASESVDTDADGVGNNADRDDDNDGVNDSIDVFPLDPNESADFDGDGIGDNADPDDGDLQANLASAGLTSQSSAQYNGWPERAIDGNISGVWAQGSITHTANEEQPWWQIQLQESSDITSIVLFNRIDACCTARLADVHVFVSETPFAEDVTLEELQAQDELWHTYLDGVQGEVVEIPVNASGTHIRVQLGRTGVLSLAEVQVIGSSRVANLTSTGSATQSSVAFGGQPSRALDGNTDGHWTHGSVTHTLTEEQPWWTVSLLQSANIKRLVLFNRTDDCCTTRLSDVYVFVSEAPFAENATLEDLKAQAGLWYTYLDGVQGAEVKVPVNITGQFVRVQLAGTGTLSLAEVEVIGIEKESNQARTGSATQSSLSYNGQPSRAIDGNNSGIWDQSSVTHTAREVQPWWQVKLSQSAEVNRIVLFNRTDTCCTARLSDVHVFVSETPFAESATLEALLDQEGLWHTYLDSVQGAEIEIPVGTTGRFVRVQLAGEGVLSLAEVEVLGIAQPTDLTSTGSATQSSVSYNGQPARAIDGNISGIWNESSVTHTAYEAQPWWQVQLLGKAGINRIVLFNRTDDCCSARLSNVHVFVSDTPFSEDTTLEELLAQGELWHTYLEGEQGAEIEIPVNTSGRYVRVQLADTGVLSLAEVEVIGFAEQ